MHAETRYFFFNFKETFGPILDSEAQHFLDQHQWNEFLFLKEGEKVWQPSDKWSHRSQRPQAQLLQSQTWRLRLGGRTSKELTEKELVDSLKSVKDLRSVEVWTKGLLNWEPVFQFHAILDQVGVSKRQHPRVPVSGTVLTENRGLQAEASLTSISEGGFGVQCDIPFQPGVTYACAIFSGDLGGVEHKLQAECVYSSGTNHGFRFQSSPQELKAQIFSLIEKSFRPKKNSQAA